VWFAELQVYHKAILLQGPLSFVDMPGQASLRLKPSPAKMFEAGSTIT
jgi:hypothetical protein